MPRLAADGVDAGILGNGDAAHEAEQCRVCQPVTRRRAEGYVSESLQWLLDDGIAETVTVTGSWRELGWLDLVVTIVRGEASRAFDIAWRATGAGYGGYGRVIPSLWSPELLGLDGALLLGTDGAILDAPL